MKRMFLMKHIFLWTLLVCKASEFSIKTTLIQLVDKDGKPYVYSSEEACEKVARGINFYSTCMELPEQE